MGSRSNASANVAAQDGADSDVDEVDDEEITSSLGSPTPTEAKLMDMGWALKAIRSSAVQRAIHPDEIGTVEDFDDDEDEYVHACVNAALEALAEG